MEKVVIEHDKKRKILTEGGYVYQETIKDPKTDEYGEMFSMIKQSDYSFGYFNLTDEEKVGKFVIESDSIFIEPFSNLVSDTKELRIDDDYTERYMTFSKTEDGEVLIEIHLLPGEYDGSIELKNIMFDLRSQADANGLDIKKKLSQFFDELMKVSEKIPGDNPVILSYK